MDISKLERMGRRRFMENLSGVGVSATTLQELTQDELTEVTHDPEEEIPYVARLRGDGDTRVPEYETIPREEWERRKTALNARDQVSQLLDQQFGNHPYSVAFAPKDQSPTGFGVEVRNPVAVDEHGARANPSKSIEELEDVLPNKMEAEVRELEEEVTREGIPIDVLNQEQELVSYNQPNYDNVPGGIAIGTTIEGGTLCAPFHSNDHGVGWTTAGHVVKERNGSGQNPVNQDYDGGIIYIGTSKDGFFDDNDLDYAFIENDNDKDNKEISKWIVDNDASEKEFKLTGIVSNEELENSVGDSSYELYGQGRTTGRQSGQIVGITGNGTETVETDWVAKDGDSGGPLFYKNDSDEAYIAGIVYAARGLPGFEDRTASTTAETTEIELDGYFLWD